jgi:stearoyl-CoA desaturase (delta-9 desaturase)
VGQQSGAVEEIQHSVKVRSDAVLGFLLCHAVAALAFIPWFFSWTGVILLLAGFIVFGVFGINIGYHRLLTHRSFSCPRWVERTLVILGVCSLEFGPAFWTAIHRRHHHHSDDEHDPHSPLSGFFWAHFGWLLVRPADMKRLPLTERYAKDVLKDPLYAWLEQRKNWMKVGAICWASYFVAGAVAAALSGASMADAARFGLSLLVWGGALRTVLVWHTTWSVNSVTHVWGYRNYNTPDLSRNNAIVGFLAAGEGWHNNHHADPGSARHGHKWWEFDFSWLMIRLLMLVGLASNPALPSPHLSGGRRSRAQSRPTPAAAPRRSA